MAAWSLGIGTQRISVESNEDAQGHVLFEPYDDQRCAITVLTPEMIKKRAIIDAAGLASEYALQALRGNVDPEHYFVGNISDQQQAGIRLATIGKPGCFAYYATLIMRELRKPDRWAIIEDVVRLLQAKSVLDANDVLALRARTPDLRSDATFWKLLDMAAP